MELVLLVVVAVVLAATYVTWMAGRLDRILLAFPGLPAPVPIPGDEQRRHVRVEGARSALDAQLLRRAAAAGELAAQVGRHGLLPEELVTGLAEAARAARDPDPADREGIENDLSRSLRTALVALPPDDVLAGAGTAALLDDLARAATRVALARSFYNGAVDDTRALRGTRLVRWLHLAGHAPQPAYFEMDDAPLPRVPTPVG